MAIASSRSETGPAQPRNLVSYPFSLSRIFSCTPPQAPDDLGVRAGGLVDRARAVGGELPGHVRVVLDGQQPPFALQFVHCLYLHA